MMVLDIAMVATIFTQPHVDKLITHMLMGSGIWQQVFHPGDFAGASAVPNSTPYSLTATGHVLQKFFQTSPALNFVKAVAPEDLGLIGVNSRLAKGVLFADRDITQQALLLINGTSEQLVINPMQIDGDWSKAETTHAPPDAPILDPSILTTESLTVQESMALPAYSVTVIQ